MIFRLLTLGWRLGGGADGACDSRWPGSWPLSRVPRSLPGGGCGRKREASFSGNSSLPAPPAGFGRWGRSASGKGGGRGFSLRGRKVRDFNFVFLDSLGLEGNGVGWGGHRYGKCDPVRDCEAGSSGQLWVIFFCLGSLQWVGIAVFCHSLSVLSRFNIILRRGGARLTSSH